MAKPKGRPKKVKVDQFSLSLQIGDKVFKGGGATMFDALSSIKKPDKIMGKGVMTITKGEQKKELLYYPIRLKRLFYNKTFQAIQAKQLSVLFQ